VRACISELEIDLPDAGIKGVYEPGQEYVIAKSVEDATPVRFVHVGGASEEEA
jgi:hypothetical protein